MKTGSDLIVAGEIILGGDIILDEYIGWMWEEDVFFAPRMVREALAQLGEGRQTVRLNSGGGHASAGEQIRAILAGHPGGCKIIVEGVAASAASLLFMGGAERLMSSGSLLMIHDPSGLAWGTEEEMRREADAIGAQAQVYAAVYAAASGKTPDETREIMKAETWFSPTDAIAAGFATGISDTPAPTDVPVVPPAPASMEERRAVFMASHDRLRTRMAKQPDGAARPDRQPAASGGAPEKENTMHRPNPAAPAAAPLAVTPPQADPAANDPIMAERARVKGIREMAAPFTMSGRLPTAEVDAACEGGLSLDAASTRFMAAMAAAEPAGRSIQITRDETETKLEGMIGAMMRQTDGPAAQYRGMKVRGLAIELSGNKRGFDDVAMVRRGMMATTMMGGAYGLSDFAYITTEVMRRTLLAEYKRRAATWQAVTGTPMTASDFRELHAARFGGDFSLKPVGENGEYKQAILKDEAEGLKVERRGRTINLTFEAVVNDDMGAFLRIPSEFAIAARNMESSMVWALFRSNTKLKSDNKALFHADHKNLAAAAALSADAVGVMRAAMWVQRPFGVSDGDDFMQVEPDRLIVPPALETKALQFVTAVTPATDGTVNPFKSTLTPIVVPNLSAAAGTGGSDTAWYLISSDLPPIAHAYLEGYEAPTVETVEGMNPDLVTMNARHIFGAAAVEFRGAAKNPGV